ncbi:MAG: hypothetical protein ACKOEL_03885, partial [Planctomycetota bacterium]
MRPTPAPVLAAALTAIAAADVKLPAAFTDHMVLQRGARARIFGSAQVSEQVDITLTDDKGAVLRTARTVA